MFRPILFSELKTYNRERFVKDIISGIIVAIIALPLSIALALASGVGPEEGLYTAIVAGFLISLFGGCNVQIAGPTAAFATIVAGVVAKSGMNGLMIASIMAGIMLLLMGILRLGGLVKYIPQTVTTGFTVGIAFSILTGQFKDFFGITYLSGEKPVETLDKLKAFFANITTVNLTAVLVGAVSLALIYLLPKIKYVGKIPASLIVVLLGSLAVGLLDLNVNTIGDLYSVRAGLPQFRLPELAGISVISLLPDAVMIAVAAAIESLLSCVVADDMTGSKHRSDTELIAQGIGNIGSVLFGGIPATGAIARTAANIKNGGTSPIAGIVHALVLLLVLVVFMPYAALIPMPVIAAILFSVAFNMARLRVFGKLFKDENAGGKTVLVLTLLLTVVFNLVIAVAAGVALSLIIKLITRKKA